MTILGNRIKQRRDELHLTQDELAAKLGYKGRSSINKIETGKADIPQSRIQEFADALDTSPAWLLGFDNEPKRDYPDDEIVDAFNRADPSVQEAIRMLLKLK